MTTQESPMSTAHGAGAGADAELLARLTHLCDVGLYRQAAALFPEIDARGTPALLIQRCRAMRNLGNGRGAEALLLRLWRQRPEDAEVRLSYLRYVQGWRGVHEALEFMRRNPLAASTEAWVRGEWLSTRAVLMGHLRDFESAAEAFEQAFALLPAEPWLWVERAYVSEMADDYAEALAHTDHALALKPDYRPALEFRFYLLRLLGREAESLAEQAQAFARMEATTLGTQLFDLYYDKGEFALATAVLDRIEALQLTPDKQARKWMAARRCDIAMRLGDVARAREQARLATGKFYEPIAQRLEGASDTGRQVLLPVPFTRQHWVTCAPATLTSLSGYWGRVAEHLEIAEAICYDGTPYHSERQWAEQAGFMTREFTLDWPTARALIDAGLPFTLSTVHTGGGHLQAVVGYDTMRNSLLIRDPFSPSLVEFEVDALLKSHAATGPRGMLMLPPAESARLEGIALPDTVLWDEYHQIMAALAVYDRQRALEALARLEATAPEHSLTLIGRRTLALYDGDENAILRATEALLARYPDETNYQLSKAASLSVVGGSGAHLAWLAALAGRAQPDPVVLGRYVAKLSEDGRRRPEAFRLARRALRMASRDATLWTQMGSLLWDEGRLAEAEPYYRAAACLDATNEWQAEIYLRLCRLIRQIDRGVALLWRRARALGKRSAPWRTLVEQLDVLERNHEAMSALEEALQRHPEDGEMLAFAADLYTRWGMQEKAGPLLARAPQAARRDEWLRVSALLAEREGRHDEAIAFARQASDASPLNMRHHRAMADLLMRLQGRAAVLEWLRAACARFPLNAALNRLLYEWLDPGDAPAAEAQLRTMLASHPEDVWTLREMGWHLLRQNRQSEALQFAEEALRRSPEQSASHSMLGGVMLYLQGYAAAEPHLRRAVELDVDNGYAMSTLIDRAPSVAQRRAALDCARAELVRQVTTGDGLLTFQMTARQVIPADELLATLREALAEREDLWHAWAAVASQLTDMGQPTEALQVLNDAVKRFPLLPRLFLEQARAWSNAGDRKQAFACAQQALAIAPGWNRAVRLAVDIVTDEGVALERAEQILRTALALVPGDADLRALLGWLLERMERQEEALAVVREALQQDPTQEWVWHCARRLLEHLKQSDQLDGMLHAAVAARPGDERTWRMQASFCSEVETALAAAQKATDLDPMNVACWQTRLTLLMRHKRLDEVTSLLDALPLPPPVPLALAAFRARVLREQGQNKAAREALQTLLADDESDYELWRELADWYDTDEAMPEYVAAAEVLVRIAPTNSNAHGYLGDALMKSKRRAEAVGPLRRGLELYPGYHFAARSLCELYAEAGDVEGLTWAIETVRPHYADATFARHEVALAALRGTLADAHAALERLACDADANDAQLEAAMAAVEKAGWKLSCLALLEGLIADGRCQRAGTKAWLTRRLAERGQDAVLKLAQAEKSNALRMALLTQAAETNDASLMKLLMGKLRTGLREDNDCWRHAGWALVRLERYMDAAAWFADWARRGELPGWAAYNIALANANVDRFKVVGEAALAGLAHTQGDVDLSVWAALAAAEAGDYASFGAHMDAADKGQVFDGLGYLLQLLRGYRAAVDSGNSALAQDAFRAMRPVKNESPYIAHACRRLAWRLVLRHTPVWKMPWRWLMLDGG